ncbi:translation initiation factor IF-2-like [Leopardus geoffroyi]|uniref:translation initiation factor IF-2-like n=1 Tax=Leopardus geoffroyi TaxID=46844 RepID=UPI001E261041|nr:translation initiation factor IF-2-like [Leopardus geoffroyi]
MEANPTSSSLQRGLAQATIICDPGCCSGHTGSTRSPPAAPPTEGARQAHLIRPSDFEPRFLPPPSSLGRQVPASCATTGLGAPHGPRPRLGSLLGSSRRSELRSPPPRPPTRRAPRKRGARMRPPAPPPGPPRPAELRVRSGRCWAGTPGGERRTGRRARGPRGDAPAGGGNGGGGGGPDAGGGLWRPRGGPATCPAAAAPAGHPAWPRSRTAGATPATVCPPATAERSRGRCLAASLRASPRCRELLPAFLRPDHTAAGQSTSNTGKRNLQRWSQQRMANKEESSITGANREKMCIAPLLLQPSQ